MTDSDLNEVVTLLRSLLQATKKLVANCPACPDTTESFLDANQQATDAMEKAEDWLQGYDISQFTDQAYFESQEAAEEDGE